MVSCSFFLSQQRAIKSQDYHCRAERELLTNLFFANTHHLQGEGEALLKPSLVAVRVP